MSEQCELRNLKSYETAAANANIPFRCLGCLALAENGRSSIAIKAGPETYESAVAEMVLYDPEFDPNGADRFSSMLFAKPNNSAKRKVLREYGFDVDDGPDGAVFTSQRITFECSVEKDDF